MFSSVAVGGLNNGLELPAKFCDNDCCVILPCEATVGGANCVKEKASVVFERGADVTGLKAP